MYKAVQHCNNCGADLTLDDLRGTSCPYCKVVYPHHSQAQQHIQVMNQMMGQMMNQQAQIQNQYRGAFGLPPAGPPPVGPPTNPYDPYGHHNQVLHAHMQHAQQMSRGIARMLIIIFAATFALVLAVVALTMFL